jgi:uncharacterized membrane protein YeaQ/YmgE (transglycosylase-associated protein family)
MDPKPTAYDLWLRLRSDGLFLGAVFACVVGLLAGAVLAPNEHRGSPFMNGVVFAVGAVVAGVRWKAAERDATESFRELQERERERERERETAGDG